MLERTLCLGFGLLLAAHAGVATADLLDPDVAFRTKVRLVKPDLIEIRYDTAPGYYLYRDRLDYALQPATASLGKPQLPPGKIKQDEFFGRSVIYRHRTIVRIPLAANGSESMTLTADLQGCADVGVCYPPVRRTFTLARSTPGIR
jgi:thiol:disulfide interchange protein DsbD